MKKGKNLARYTLILVVVALVIVCILVLLGPAVGDIFHRLTAT